MTTQSPCGSYDFSMLHYFEKKNVLEPTFV